MKFYKLIVNYRYEKDTFMYNELQVKKSIQTNSGDHIGNYFYKMAPDDIVVPAVELNKAVNLTDVIDTRTVAVFGLNSNSIIISSKVKDILCKFNSTPLQFFKTYLLQSKEKFDNYWVMHGSGYGYEFIDFSKSEIKFSTFGNYELEKWNLSSYEEFLSIRNNLTYPKCISVTKIKLNPFIEKDIFCIVESTDFSSFFISERVKQELEQKECTGLEFIECD
jgi:hypothetical protein